VIKAYKKGDLVTYKVDHHLSSHGVGIIVLYNRWLGLYKVWWPTKGVFDHHVIETLSRLDCE
jgi:hypothetical protein